MKNQFGEVDEGIDGPLTPEQLATDVFEAYLSTCRVLHIYYVVKKFQDHWSASLRLPEHWPIREARTVSTCGHRERTVAIRKALEMAFFALVNDGKQFRADVIMVAQRERERAAEIAEEMYDEAKCFSIKHEPRIAIPDVFELCQRIGQKIRDGV